jgi:hypothetical protein
MAVYKIVRLDVKNDKKTDSGKQFSTKTEAQIEVDLLNSRVRDLNEARYEIEEG